MGAKHLNPVPIMCQLTQWQIEHLAAHVADSLPFRLDELEDIDELMFGDSIRLCVDFEVDTMNNIIVSEAEILNKDWDILHTDSFALRHYLVPMVERYNQYRHQAISQCRDIRRETKQSAFI